MSRLEELIQELCPNGVEYKPLIDILKIKNGSDYKKFSEGNIPVYGSGGIIAYIDRFVYDKPSVLIPRKGSIDKLYYVDTPFWTVDTIFYTEINTKIAEPKSIYFNFTELTAELTAELAARKKQYEYYRGKLLTYNINIHKKTLDEL